MGIGLYGMSQQTTNSPVSSIGIGEWEQETPTFLQSLGGAGIAAISDNKINYSNPASVGYLSQPVYDVGLMVYSNSIQTDTGKAVKNNVYMQNVFLGLPVIKRWWSAAVGLKPLTKMNYNFNNQWTDSLGTYTQEYSGFGGINELKISNSFNILKDSINYLAVGVNTSYLFGSIQKTAKIIFPDGSDAFNTQDIVRYDFSGLYLSGGVLASRKISDNISVSLGGTYGYSQPIRTIRLKLINTYEGTNALSNVKDTISYINDTLQSSLPSFYSAGVAFSTEKFWAGATWTTRNLSEITLAGIALQLSQYNQISLGVQYTPNPEALNDLVSLSSYRLGLRRANISGKNVSVSELGIGFGIGIPVIRSKSNTTFNFAVEVGNRQYENFAPALKNEVFSKISFGFSFCPHKFDRWFYRQKID
jgi:hypothetical protein